MKRFPRAGVCALLGALLTASAAGAASLTVTADQATYTVGQTITLTVTGLHQGGSDDAIQGRLLYDAGLTHTVGSSQTTHTSGTTPALPWLVGALATGDGFATVFNQSRGGILPPASVNQDQDAVATLVAEAVGLVTIGWDLGGLPLDFFGVTNAAGTSFNIVNAPEPATAVLVGLGLTGLALAGRRRR